MSRRSDARHDRVRALRRYVAGVACTLATWTAAAADCPARLRLISYDPGETRAASPDTGVRRLLEAVGVAVVEQAGLAVETRSGPYARVIRDIESGHADLTVLSVVSMAGVQGLGRSVPVSRLYLQAYRAVDPPAQPASVPGWALVNGVPMPPGLADGQSVVKVASYPALVQMLLLRRVQQIVAFRPTIDVYLRDRPAERQRLSPPTPISEQRMAVHIASRLPLACQDRLAAAAQTVQRSQMRTLFEKHLPGVPVDDFLLP